MNGGDAAPSSRRDFRLGNWLVDADLGRLRQGEKEIYLRPQLMQMLLLLTEHQGGFVPAKRLIERVWGRRFVSPSVLARCISDLRHALCDDARAPTYIETLPKRGYRMAVCVLPLTSGGPIPGKRNAILSQIQSLEEPSVVQGWRDVFVGRNAELSLLDRRLHQALRGAGNVVLVSGEPGSGKTVLLSEFVRRATATHHGLLIASGRGNAPGGFGEPLGLFREILALLTGDVQSRTAMGDLEPEQADRLWRGSPEVIRLVLDLAPALIGGLLPVPILLERARAVGLERPTCERLAEVARQRATVAAADGQRQDQLAGQIAEMLTKVSSHAPLALLLDDLQWCDSASCAVFFQLARALSHQRLLVVAAFRSQEGGGGDQRNGSFGDWVAELKSRGEAEIINLDLAGGRGFVDAFLDAEPNRFSEDFRARFTRCTGGSPLFTAELLNGMQEGRIISPDGEGKWGVEGDLDWSRIPGRLNPVIAQRMGRLPPRLRQLLNVAAVEGEEFTAEIVAGVLGRDTMHVAGDLGEWIERRLHLVVPLGVQRLGQSRRSVYRFRHTLFQSWLYAQLDPAERALLHERIGRVIERLYPTHDGVLAGPLARHFAAADLPEQAIGYYRQAARHATGLAADQEALQFLRTGLSLVKQLPPGKSRDRSELDFELAQGLTLIALRGYASPEVNDCLYRIRELCHRTGEQTHWFGMLWQHNMLAGLGAEYGAALKAAEEMLAIAGQFLDANSAALAFLARGWVLLMMGRFAEALSDLDRATAMKGTPHEVVAAYGLEPRATALAWSSWIHWFHGNVAAARGCSARAIALARESDNPLTLAFCLGVAGASFHSLLEEPEESLRLSDEVDVLASEHGVAFYSAGAQLYRGYAHFLQGLYARSIEEIEAGLARWSAAGTLAYRGFFLSLVALAHHHLGHASEAMRCVEAAIQHVETTGERMFESEIRRHFALLLEAAGDSKRAKAELGRAIKVARQQGASVFLQRAIASLAASCRMRIRSRNRASGTAGG